MSWDQLLAPGLTVRDSPAETERFGCSIQRVTIGPGPVEPAALLAQIEHLPADVLVVRYDAARLELPGTLARSRRAVVPAGTLTYWEKPVSDTAPGAPPPAPPATPSGLAVVPANAMGVQAPGGLAAVTAVVREIVLTSFDDYRNHYSANPLLDPAAALAGYQEWAVRSLMDDPGNVLVMTEHDKPVGMATLEPGPDGHDLEILLAGLVPAAQGRRLYASLLQACEVVAAARGASRLVISTQVHNVRVQRAWAREGLRPFAAVETVHLIDRDLLLASHRKDD